MSNNSSTGGGGVMGFTGVLLIAFIVLKLTGVINWSWLWVLSPIWISGLLFLGMIVAILIMRRGRFK